MRSNFFDIVASHQREPRVKPRNLQFYVERQLFAGLEFTGCEFLDIGAGTGLYGLYAAVQGAQRVDLLEPESDGSSMGVVSIMHRIIDSCQLTNAVHHRTAFETFCSSQEYDFVLLHNAINHLDEESCEQLHKSSAAREIYRLGIFERLRTITRLGGTLIITDCGRRNFFGDIGVTAPVARTIEWNKHQGWRTWAGLLAETGFRVESIRYTSLNTLRELGLILLNNPIGNYFLHSHFILHLRRQT